MVYYNIKVVAIATKRLFYVVSVKLGVIRPA